MLDGFLNLSPSLLMPVCKSFPFITGCWSLLNPLIVGRPLISLIMITTQFFQVPSSHVCTSQFRLWGKRFPVQGMPTPPFHLCTVYRRPLIKTFDHLLRAALQTPQLQTLKAGHNFFMGSLSKLTAHHQQVIFICGAPDDYTMNTHVVGCMLVKMWWKELRLADVLYLQCSSCLKVTNKWRNSNPNLLSSTWTQIDPALQVVFFLVVSILNTNAMLWYIYFRCLAVSSQVIQWPNSWTALTNQGQAWWKQE